MSDTREAIAKAMYEAPIDGDPGTWPPTHPEDRRFWHERADAVLAAFDVTPKEPA